VQIGHRRRFADDVLVDSRHDAQNRRLSRAIEAEQADLGAGKKESEMSLMIWRLGGTILPTRFIVNTY
jgi:hypothetical protein